MFKITFQSIQRLMSLLHMVGYKWEIYFVSHVCLYPPSHYLAKIYTLIPSINFAVMLHFSVEVYRQNKGEDQCN